VEAAAALLFLCGAGKAFFEVTARTLLQRLLPDRLLIAVFGGSRPASPHSRSMTAHLFWNVSGSAQVCHAEA
jgi:hypothetical protein